MKNWFEGIKTLQELKTAYRKLALQWHPDREGGDLETMQQINAQYEKMLKIVIDIDPKMQNKTEHGKRQEYQFGLDIMVMVQKIVHLQNVTIEIIGTWVWVSDDTFPYRQYLRQLGFAWGTQKRAWYWHADEFRKLSDKRFTMDELRDMFGTKHVENIEAEALEAEANIA